MAGWLDRALVAACNANCSYYRMQAVYVCVCNGVTDRDIQRAVDEGCDSLDALAARTGCGSTCGCCREYAEEAILQAQSKSLGLPIAA